jgi:hypothetical protein
MIPVHSKYCTFEGQQALFIFMSYVQRAFGWISESGCFFYKFYDLTLFLQYQLFYSLVPYLWGELIVALALKKLTVQRFLNRVFVAKSWTI